MTAFNHLSALTGSLFGLWALLMICAAISSAVLSLSMKRYRYGDEYEKIKIFICFI